MSLTGSTAKITITQPTLFSSAQPISGFMADDVTDMDPVQIVEHLMGVDGVLSFGFVWKERMQQISLQADSASNNVFDIINTQQQAIEDVYPISSTILMPALGLKFECVNGALETYPPMPNVKRLIQPRKYRIVWNRVTPSLTA